MLIAFMYGIHGYAQTDTALTHAEIVQAPGQTKEALFIKARQWFNESFKNSNAVLRIDDKETGELSGKGNADISIPPRNKAFMPDAYTIHFTLSIIVKEGRYKYEFTDISASDISYDFGELTTSDIAPKHIRYFGMSKKKVDSRFAMMKTEAMEQLAELGQNLKAKLAGADKTDF
jgi:hypothetical protein